MRHYIEPFMGSACVFFDTAPTSASLSDFNADLVLFFSELRDHPNDLIASLRSMHPEGDDYYDVRAQDASSLSPSRAAARFFYLNRFSFNGVYRTNRRGEFNVPRGARTGAIPGDAELLAAASHLRQVNITCCDYRQATARAVHSDFVYLDPPYRNDSRETYGEYGYSSFGSAEDVAELGEELRRLDAIGARVLLSFNNDEGLETVLNEWNVIRVSRTRSVAAAATSRTALMGEILAMNYEPEATLA